MLVGLLAAGVSGCGKKKADTDAVVNAMESLSKAKSVTSGQIRSARSASLASFSSTRPDFEILGKPCETSQPNHAEIQNGSMDFNQKFSIGGKECPIQFESEFQLSSKAVLMEMNFKSVTEEAKQAFEIDSFLLKLELSGDEKTAELSMFLEAQTLKHGKVGFDLSGEMDKDGGEISGDIEVDNKVAEYKQVIHFKDGKETSEYYLNGEKLTEDQVKKIGNIFDRSELSQSLQ